MNIDTDSRLRINVVDLDTSIDSTGATLEIRIDGTWYPCEWTTDAAQIEPKRWRRNGRTVEFFAGSGVATDDLDGATVLAAGHYPTKTRVTWPAGDSVADFGGHIVVE